MLIKPKVWVGVGGEKGNVGSRPSSMDFFKNHSLKKIKDQKVRFVYHLQHHTACINSQPTEWLSKSNPNSISMKKQGGTSIGCEEIR